MNEQEDYIGLDNEALQRLCGLKDRRAEILIRELRESREVIDAVAKKFDLHNEGKYLYWLIDGEAPLVNKIEEYLSCEGDKVQIKKRLDELENENRILRSVVGGVK
jgi:hypothetical protein